MTRWVGGGKTCSFLSALALCLICALIVGGALVAQAQGVGYRLDVGDFIRIQVFREDDLTRDIRVSAAGTISYPLVGELRVSGLTPAELEKVLQESLKNGFLADPVVNVNILEYRPFFINGEVEKSGAFPYQPDLTVRKAISLAGGFKERASSRKIFIIRGNGSGHKPIRADMDSAVQPGDVITVERSFF